MRRILDILDFKSKKLYGNKSKSTSKQPVIHNDKSKQPQSQIKTTSDTRIGCKQSQKQKQPQSQIKTTSDTRIGCKQAQAQSQKQKQPQSQKQKYKIRKLKNTKYEYNSGAWVKTTTFTIKNTNGM